MPVLTIRDKRILYIHVPKTGGTSVEDLLRSYGGSVSLYSPHASGLPCVPQHFHGEMLREVCGLSGRADGREHDFDFIFMTIRHPIARLISEYRYQRSFAAKPAVRAHPDKLLRNPFKNSPVAEKLGFDLWCRYALLRYSRNPFFAGNHLRPQAEFSVWDPAVYRLEDGLECIRERLDELIGEVGHLPAERRKVSTDRAGSEEHLKDSTRKLIKAHYSRDFAEYGYGYA